MRKPTLFLAAALTSPLAQAENAISYQALKYHEQDDRIDVIGSAVTVDQDFGTDYHAKVGFDYDSVSGATPLWKPKQGYVSEYEQGLQPLADEARNGVAGSFLMRDQKRNEYTFGAGWSQEPDYIARQLSAQAMLYQDETHNRSFNIGAGVLENTAIATDYTNHRDDENATMLSLQGGVTQTIDRTSSAEFSLYYGKDKGYLSNQYLKIVRLDSETGLHYLSNDERPGDRESAGFATRYIKSLSEGLVAQLFYRFYDDDWGIRANTLEAKFYLDLNPHWRLNPVLRFHQQSAADFYRAYDDAVNSFASTGFGSNDARLGELQATTAQFNVEFQPTEEWSLNAGISDYRQDNGFEAGWLTAGFTLRY